MRGVVVTLLSCVFLASVLAPGAYGVAGPHASQPGVLAHARGAEDVAVESKLAALVELQGKTGALVQAGVDPFTIVVFAAKTLFNIASMIYKIHLANEQAKQLSNVLDLVVSDSRCETAFSAYEVVLSLSQQSALFDNLLNSTNLHTAESCKQVMTQACSLVKNVGVDKVASASEPPAPPQQSVGGHDAESGASDSVSSASVSSASVSSASVDAPAPPAPSDSASSDSGGDGQTTHDTTGSNSHSNNNGNEHLDQMANFVEMLVRARQRRQQQQQQQQQHAPTNPLTESPEAKYAKNNGNAQAAFDFWRKMDKVRQAFFGKLSGAASSASSRPGSGTAEPAGDRAPWNAETDSSNKFLSDAEFREAVDILLTNSGAESAQSLWERTHSHAMLRAMCSRPAHVTCKKLHKSSRAVEAISMQLIERTRETTISRCMEIPEFGRAGSKDRQDRPETLLTMSRGTMVEDIVRDMENDIWTSTSMGTQGMPTMKKLVSLKRVSTSDTAKQLFEKLKKLNNNDWKVEAGSIDYEGIAEVGLKALEYFAHRYLNKSPDIISAANTRSKRQKCDGLMEMAMLIPEAQKLFLNYQKLSNFANDMFPSAAEHSTHFTPTVHGLVKHIYNAYVGDQVFRMTTSRSYCRREGKMMARQLGWDQNTRAEWHNDCRLALRVALNLMDPDTEAADRNLILLTSKNAARVYMNMLMRAYKNKATRVSASIERELRDTGCFAMTHVQQARFLRKMSFERYERELTPSELDKWLLRSARGDSTDPMCSVADMFFCVATVMHHRCPSSIKQLSVADILALHYKKYRQIYPWKTNIAGVGGEEFDPMGAAELVRRARRVEEALTKLGRRADDKTVRPQWDFVKYVLGHAVRHHGNPAHVPQNATWKDAPKPSKLWADSLWRGVIEPLAVGCGHLFRDANQYFWESDMPNGSPMQCQHPVDAAEFVSSMRGDMVFGDLRWAISPMYAMHDITTTDATVKRWRRDAADWIRSSDEYDKNVDSIGEKARKFLAKFVDVKRGLDDPLPSLTCPNDWVGDLKDSSANPLEAVFGPMPDIYRAAYNIQPNRIKFMRRCRNCLSINDHDGGQDMFFCALPTRTGCQANFHANVAMPEGSHGKCPSTLALKQKSQCDNIEMLLNMYYRDQQSFDERSGTTGGAGSPLRALTNIMTGEDNDHSGGSGSNNSGSGKQGHHQEQERGENSGTEEHQSSGGSGPSTASSSSAHARKVDIHSDAFGRTQSDFQIESYLSQSARRRRHMCKHSLQGEKQEMSRTKCLRLVRQFEGQSSIGMDDAKFCAALELDTSKLKKSERVEQRPCLRSLAWAFPSDWTKNAPGKHSLEVLAREKRLLYCELSEVGDMTKERKQSDREAERKQQEHETHRALPAEHGRYDVLRDFAQTKDQKACMSTALEVVNHPDDKVFCRLYCLTVHSKDKKVELCDNRCKNRIVNLRVQYGQTVARLSPTERGKRLDRLRGFCQGMDDEDDREKCAKLAGKVELFRDTEVADFCHRACAVVHSVGFWGGMPCEKRLKCNSACYYFSGYKHMPVRKSLVCDKNNDEDL